MHCITRDVFFFVCLFLLCWLFIGVQVPHTRKIGVFCWNQVFTSFLSIFYKHLNKTKFQLIMPHTKLYTSLKSKKKVQLNTWLFSSTVCRIKSLEAHRKKNFFRFLKTKILAFILPETDDKKDYYNLWDIWQIYMYCMLLSFACI